LLTRWKPRGIDTASESKIAFVEGRKAANVVMAVDEERLLDEHAMNRIGKMLITQVRTRDIQGILNHAAKTLSRESLRKLRGALHRMFDVPWKAELIKENPVDRATVPIDARVDERPRTILTDAETRSFLEGRASGSNGKKPRKDAEVRLHELKVMAVCSRVLGGLRIAEVIRWSWDMIVDPDVDVRTPTYTSVKVRRAKAKRGRVGKVQTMLVPEGMRPILREWHEVQGALRAVPCSG
jgi:integrase